MLIWEPYKKGHRIRIRSVNEFELEADKINLDSLTLEKDIEQSVNAKLSGYHIYIHVFSKDIIVKELNYSMWIGPIDVEPLVRPGRKEWWEKIG